MTTSSTFGVLNDVLCDMLMSAGAAPGGGRDVRGYEHGAYRWRYAFNSTRAKTWRVAAEHGRTLALCDEVLRAGGARAVSNDVCQSRFQVTLSKNSVHRKPE